MKKGTKVSWTLKNGGGTGRGTVIADELDGHVQVAVEEKTSNGSTTSWEEKYIIHCAVTWLTVEA